MRQEGAMDLLMQAAWTLLAVAAVLLPCRRRAPARDAWWLVAAACCLVALDKAVDVQVWCFTTAKALVQAAVASLGLDGERRLLRHVLLVAATGAAVVGTVVLVRRDPDLDRAKRCALAGLVLVVLLVGLRLLPGFAWLHDERVGWLVEGLGCGLVAIGLRRGFRGLRPRTA
jgi:hypothetical protein